MFAQLLITFLSLTQLTAASSFVTIIAPEVALSPGTEARRNVGEIEARQSTPSQVPTACEADCGPVEAEVGQVSWTTTHSLHSIENVHV